MALKMCEACVHYGHVWDGVSTHGKHGCTVAGCQCREARCRVKDSRGDQCYEMREGHATAGTGPDQVLVHQNATAVWKHRERKPGVVRAVRKV